MTRKIAFLPVFLFVAMAMVLVTCKPITSYLEKVDKAYGKVTEAGSGVALESVEVIVGNYQYSELTNSLGDYEIELSDGKWTLTFVKSGYVTATQAVTVSPSNPRVKVDVALAKVVDESLFISFKFDGVQYKYVEGLLEYGNVPFAFLDIGWEKEGQVYDRTEILAYPVGLSIQNAPSSENGIEISLVGIPGSQPPLAGTYTYTDGYHGVHDFFCGSPLPRCFVDTDKYGNHGSATVIVTKGGAEGDFIEGTFSATVLEEDTLTPHNITEGAFRVKKITF